MAISFYSANQATGVSLTIDIGSQGQNRVVLIYLGEEGKPGNIFQGTVTVDGKLCEQRLVDEEPSGLGAHLELHSIDENALGNSNGVVNVVFSGGTPDWGIHVIVHTGVKNSTFFDSGVAQLPGPVPTINVNNINSADNSLVVMGVINGNSLIAFSNWTAPLIVRTSDAPLPVGAQMGTSSGVEVTAQSLKTYSVDFVPDGGRTIAFVTVFEQREIVVTNVTSDSPNGDYTVDDEIFICSEFSEQVDVTGKPLLDLDVKPFGRQVCYAPNWTPDDLVCQLWYDASDLSTITELNDLISKWDDKSGNSIDLLQAVDLSKPLAYQESINGLHAIQFVMQYLSSASNPFGVSIQDAHLFMVLRTPPVLANATHFSLSGNPTPNRWQAHVPWGNGIGYFDAGSNAIPDRLQVNDWLTENEEAVVSFYNSTTESVQQMYKNGTLSLGDNSAVAPLTNPHLDIGWDGSAQTGDMILGEVVVINGTVTTALRQSIEGYLAWKWGQEANLAGGHPYKTRPPLKWTPDKIKTAVWFDASDPNSIADTAGAVTQWNDKSGNDRHAKQPDIAKQPVTGVRSQNGLNAVDFVKGGTPDLMVTDFPATWLNDTEYTFFIVANQDLAGSGYFVGTQHQGNGKGLHIGWSSNVLWKIAQFNDDGEFPEVQSTAVELSTSQAKLPNSELWKNGTSQGTFPLPANGLDTSGVFSLGAGFRQTVENMDGMLCEVVCITGPITTNEREQVEGYLAWKWGLASNLPVSHPYASMPPLM